MRETKEKQEELEKRKEKKKNKNIRKIGNFYQPATHVWTIPNKEIRETKKRREGEAERREKRSVG